MSLPTCGTGCTNNLPVFSFKKCAPEIHNGQISKIYFTTVGNPLSNWASAVEWDSRLDNDAAGAAKIRALMVIGDWPEPEQEIKDISLGRKFYGTKKFSANFRVDDDSDANYEAVRTLDCNRGNYLIWIETRDGKLHGGSAGIEGQITMNYTIPESYQENIVYPGKVTWESQYHPERIQSPIVSTTGDQFSDD